jgi:regulator of sigma E protease
MTLLIQIAIGLFVLGILVLIHESGHFFAAKACGIRVLSFSIGFGKPLLVKTIGSTEYRLSAIPFGGYVHMAGEHPEDDHAAADDEFTSKPVWQRAAVAIAGPAANLVFSIVVLWILFIHGVDRPLYLDSSTIGAIAENSPAAKTALVPGDSIVSINGTAVADWEDVQYALSLQDQRSVVEYIRNGSRQQVVIENEEHKGSGLEDPFLGLQPCYPAKIGEIHDLSTAKQYGLQTGDRVIAIDNTTIHSWFQLSEIVSRFNPFYGSLQLVVRRNDSILVIDAAPKFNKAENRYLLGITRSEPETRLVKYSVIGAIPQTLAKTGEYTVMIFRILPNLPRIFAKIITRPTTPQGLAGPVGIVQISGAVAFGGLAALLDFIALIGINLGVLNLFPLIITDGGVLLFLCIESLRRKPLSLKTQMFLNRIAIAFFITLFVFITFNDIMRMPTLFRLFGH